MTDHQVDQCATVYDELVLWNEKVNLTKITGEDEAIVKHFVDSFTPVQILTDEERSQPLRMIDIGTGGGFPAIPLLILFPHWQATLVDSVGKKLNFVRHALETIGIKAEVLHMRAEDLAHQKERRERYDLAIARALADLPVLLELTLPFIKVGGRLIAMKGKAVADEVARASKAIHMLGGGNPVTTSLVLPDDVGERSLISVAKLKATPALYPRQAGTPQAAPLV
ncbi:MAG: 16S rRNA (guanine(527)-N(7))-methyltransferase RsmG [Candidatus Sericytochromatia bacterium]|nr:16S rRNA (guanine(527)-N(7))-methyltransferase RsmG [Candidatus Sericytochromatia bacterium]